MTDADLDLGLVPLMDFPRMAKFETLQFKPFFGVISPSYERFTETEFPNRDGIMLPFASLSLSERKVAKEKIAHDAGYIYRVVLDETELYHICRRLVETQVQCKPWTIIDWADGGGRITRHTDAATAVLFKLSAD